MYSLLVRTDKFEMVIVLTCINEVDETTGMFKWTQNAKDKIKKLNTDCNLKAGLKAVLQIAVRGHVMLRRNIDRYHRLVWPNKRYCALAVPFLRTYR